jgi:uncharacterized protein YdeI (YjbR/CyaY-like superfamily)
MPTLNPEIDLYLAEGCGRCPLGGTPQCKVHDWTKELKRLRSIVLDCGLVEELKWKVPCYTLEGHNILIVAAFRDFCSVSFFKGSLLKDTFSVLDKPGENSQAARLIRITSVKEITTKEEAIRDCIRQAIEIEKSGKKVDFKAKTELVLPAELLEKFDELPVLRTAFEALTPGRQRGYVLFFTGAKQSKTKVDRIVKCIPRILEGLGMHD